MTYDWLDAYIEAAALMARTCGLDFEWQQEQPATDADIATCEDAIGVSLALSHRAFLERCNGASLGYTYGYGNDSFGNTVFVLSTRGIVEQFVRMREYYEDPKYEDDLANHPERQWRQLIPTLDLQDSNYLVSDPHASIDGEYPFLYADHELGPEWWRDTKHISPSFDELLRTMFTTYLEHRRNFEFWDGMEAMI